MYAQSLFDQTESYRWLGQSEAALLAAQDALVIGQQIGSRLFVLRAQRLLPGNDSA